MHRISLVPLVLLGSTSVLAAQSGDENIYPHLFVGMSGEHVSPEGDNTSDTSSIGVNIGTQINRNIAWDVGYQYVNDPYDNKKADIGIFNVTGRYDLFLSQKVSLYFKGGIGYWMLDSYADTITKATSANGVSPLGELGVNYRITPKLFFNLGYKYISDVGNRDVAGFDQHSLIAGATYHFKGEAFQEIVNEQPDTPSPQSAFSEPQKLLAVTFDARDIKFDFDSSEIKLTESLSLKISEIVQFLSDNPQVKIEVIGHTDSLGSDAYNLALSTQRAKAVAQLVINRGVSKMRVSVVGKGENEPIVTNSTAIGRAQNRRVEISERGKNGN